MKRPSPQQIILFVALWALCACSTDRQYVDVVETGGDVEIQFSSTAVATNAVTRAAADTYNNSLPSGSNIGVYIYDSDNIDISTTQPTAGTPSTTWVYQTVGEADPTTHKSALRLISHARNPKFPFVTGSNTEFKSYVEVFAVFPNNSNVTPSTADYTFTVSSDQTVDNNIKNSDLLTSALNRYTYDDCNGKLLDLTLNHRMAKIQVVFSPKSGGDLTEDNMPINFDVVSVQRSVIVTLKTGDVITNTDANDKATMSNPIKAFTTSPFFIPPQSVAAGETMLRFNILSTENFQGIDGATFKVPSGGVTFEAGHSYQINVTVDVDFNTLTGTITQWSEESMSFEPIIL